MQHKSPKATTNGIENWERRNSKPVAKLVAKLLLSFQLPLVVSLWPIFLAKDVFVKVILCPFFFFCIAKDVLSRGVSCDSMSP